MQEGHADEGRGRSVLGVGDGTVAMKKQEYSQR
jgi:hypothetical protein